MSRLRRVDKALIAESSDDFPMDSDDQELLLSQLSDKNNGSHALYTRILILSIVAEFPAVTFLIRSIIGKDLKLTAYYILLSLLCLVGALYDLSAVANLVRVNFISDQWKRRVISFSLLCVVNAILLVQFYWTIYRQHGLHIKFLFLVLPVVNYVVMILVRNWYTHTAEEIRQLYDLRYKFKSV